MTKPRYRPDGRGDWREVAPPPVIRAARRVDDEPAFYSEHPSFRDDFHDLPSRRKTAPETTMNADQIITRYVGSQRTHDRGGFRDLGEFAALVKVASNPEPGPAAAKAAERLRAAALTEYGREGVGADGGFAVPPEFREAIMNKITGNDTLLSRVDVVPTGNNSVSFPKDESTPWQATGGIRGYWEGEAATIPQSKPALETSTIKLHKLHALVPMTDELLEDAPALSQHLLTKGTDAITWKVDDSIVNGSGAGQLLGLLTSGHKVAVSKETSQIAATVHGLNLVKMWARMPAQWRSSAVWLAHPDVEPQLLSAGLQVASADGTSVTGGQLIYKPAGSIADSPYATLFGRPVIPSQACQALGTAGDLIFWCPQQYAVFSRTEGIKFDSSIHLWFDQGVTAFRFTFRLGGQPWWSSPISPKNGSTTQSSIVTLATRS